MQPKQEIRIHHDQISRIPAKVLEQVNVISVGHTGCVHKMKDIGFDDIETLLLTGKEVKIETPIIFQNQLETFSHKIKQWLDYPISLVINDWGLLHWLNEIQVPSHVSLSLGRNLVYSYFNCPWHEDILMEEEVEMRNQWLSVNLANPTLLTSILRMGVQGIELDLSPYVQKSVELFKQEGLEVTGFTSYPLSSISRSCHAVRLHKGEIGQCQHLCDAGIQLEPRQRWNRFDDTMTRISKENREKMGQLMVYGNVVVQSTKESVDIVANVDTLCTDYRFSPHQLDQKKEFSDYAYTK
jgi:hypothetical protein